MGDFEKRLVGVCGLNCGDCEIRRVPNDPQAAERVAAWFKEKGWLKENEGVAELVERSPYCMGCGGNRSVHWSSNCWILKCCVDEKGLEFCHECDLFPCEQLSNWAKGSPRYARALERLNEIKERLDQRPRGG